MILILKIDTTRELNSGQKGGIVSGEAKQRLAFTLLQLSVAAYVYVIAVITDSCVFFGLASFLIAPRMYLIALLGALALVGHSASRQLLGELTQMYRDDIAVGASILVHLPLVAVLWLLYHS